MKRVARVPKTQASCAPMAQAFAEGCENILPRHIVPCPAGIAEATLRGDPTRAYPYIRQITLESGAAIVSASEQEIRDARCMVEEYEGLDVCFSSATAVAGLVKQARSQSFPLDDTVMINLTGADRTGNTQTQNVRWLRREGSTGSRSDQCTAALLAARKILGTDTPWLISPFQRRGAYRIRMV